MAVTKASVIRPFTCNECLHFNKVPLPGHDQVCSKEGVRGSALAPKCFTPDITKLTTNSDAFTQITHLVSGLTSAEKRTLFALLNMKNKHYKFGTKVYFRVTNREYLSNYLCGYVVGVTHGKIMVMGDPDKRKRGKPYIAYFNDSEHLLSMKEFMHKKRQLVEHNLIDDPKKPTVKKKVEVNHEPPTIDSVLDKRGKAKRVEEVDRKISGFTRPSKLVILSKDD